MSRATMFERYDNGKIKKPYVTLDMTICGLMTDLDRAKVGNIILALYEYERSGGEEKPKLATREERKYFEALAEKHEMCRNQWQTKSEQRKAASDAATVARNNAAKQLKELN